MKLSFRIFALVLSVVATIGGIGASSASAAKAVFPEETPAVAVMAIFPEKGTVNSATRVQTISNPNTGEELAVFCEGASIDGIVGTTNDAFIVGASTSAPCSGVSFPGYAPVVNVDPHDGWVIAHSSQVGTTNILVAYTCVDEGTAFAVKIPGEELYTFSQEGDCYAGMMPA